MADAKDFLFEIGTEEMPSAPLNNAVKQLGTMIAKGLDEAGLAHGEVRVISSPRRLAALVANVATATDEVHEVKRGPAANIAFDADGNATKAAQGFARKCGVATEDLVRREDTDGREYVFAEKNIPSAPATPILTALCEKTIAGLQWPNYRSQRWGHEHATFVRPVRWICCLLGEDVVPVSFADVTSGNTTRGHRVLGPGDHTVASPAVYEQVLEDAGVLSAERRREAILAGIAEVEAARPGCHVDTPKKVFEEVINLCEWPTVLVGTFDEEFLKVPHEIICESMLTNQRYFPIYDGEGKLTREFVVVSNSKPENAERVIDGNERVVRARLDDAAFFVVEDRRKPLEGYVEGLKRVVFQERLGSVYDKTMRIVKCAEAVCDAAGITGTQRDDILRTALLCKADLITSAVVEFTSLQGIMGGHYARFSGETPEVALGITDHYRPRFADDDLPRNLAGTVTAFSDKLDTICGIFAIGAGPTGSSDPFALRRAAIGIVNILLSGLDVSLSELIDVALGNYRDVVDFDFDAVRDQVRAFFATRLEVIARDRGYAPDCIAAVMATGMFEPAETIARIDALQTARDEQPDTFENLATAYTRAANLADVALGCEADEALMGTQERALADAIAVAQESVGQALAAGAHVDAIEALAGLRAPIDSFFDGVLIMDDDLALREMRLRLLNSFVDVFANVADIGKMAKK